MLSQADTRLDILREGTATAAELNRLLAISQPTLSRRIWTSPAMQRSISWRNVEDSLRPFLRPAFHQICGNRLEHFVEALPSQSLGLPEQERYRATGFM